MATRLIPFSIAATLGGIFWLSTILYMDRDAHAESALPPTTYEEEKEKGSVPSVPDPEIEGNTEQQTQAEEPPVSESASAQKEESVYLISPEKVKLEFSSKGGGLKSAFLLLEQFDRRELKEDKDGIGIPEEKRAKGPLDIVTTWDSEFYPFQETFEVLNWVGQDGREEAITFGEEKGTKRSRNHGIVAQSKEAVTFVWPNPHVYPTSEMYVSKTIQLQKGYAASVSTVIYNLGTRKIDFKMNQEIFGWQASTEGSMIGTRPNLTAGACGVSGETIYEEFGELLDESSSGILTEGDVSWIGLTDQYFLLAAIPHAVPTSSCDLRAIPVKQLGESTMGLVEAQLRQNQTKTIHPKPEPTCIPQWLPKEHPSSGANLPTCTSLYGILNATAGDNLQRAKKKAMIEAKGDSSKIRAIGAAYERLAKPSLEEMRWTIYAGPKDISEMDAQGEDVGLSATLDFGILEMISLPMLLLMRWAHQFLHSWALAIVLLTIMVKLLLFPLTRKSLVQMKKMQDLKPEMEKLKAKHENDKQKLNTEMFALYKRHGVNPLGGCLPMVIQMPIYIALYNTLYASVSLYQQPLFGWVTDLTSPDPYYVLPVILGATMFIQQKMNPTAMDSQQAQMMMYVMPVMFTGFMLFLPSGLVLYIFTNTVLTLVQQYFLNKKPA